MAKYPPLPDDFTPSTKSLNEIMSSLSGPPSILDNYPDLGRELRSQQERDEQDKALADRDRAERLQALEYTRKNTELAQKNAELTEKNTELAEKNGELAQKNNDLTQDQNHLLRTLSEANKRSGNIAAWLAGATLGASIVAIVVTILVA